MGCTRTYTVTFSGIVVPDARFASLNPNQAFTVRCPNKNPAGTCVYSYTSSQDDDGFYQTVAVITDQSGISGRYYHIELRQFRLIVDQDNPEKIMTITTIAFHGQGKSSTVTNTREAGGTAVISA